MLLQYRHGQDAKHDALHVLGDACYGTPHTHQTTLAVVPMACLPAGGHEYTTWLSTAPCETGVLEGVAYHYTEHLLFGAMSIAEHDFVPNAQASALQQASALAYQRLFAVMRHTSFNQLVRCWNYLPGINVDGGGLERYRQFNIGRQDAFIAARRDHLEGAPAACALGTGEGDLVLYFMAAHARPRPIENPRQVSAYRYPDRYGPRSPTFSRASLLELPGCEALFISGTASIVGHESVHLGDVKAQTEETLRNIEALIAQANLKSHVGGYSTQALEMKVFLRDPADQALVASVLRQHLGCEPRAFYLQADICRVELLVEIEAVGLRSKT
ncbi:Rid family hydrolase [Uliginosibacterium gangwonense]|uniref:chorismate transformation enzyme, FkbO/Hyg5 family n=1 Tax=Uliginosibacterium gangwonense TaxID=392736 RepID=UPI00035CC5E8|nr:Rid family hydrolase [Uliginosibacterium gangwonense]